MSPPVGSWGGAGAGTSCGVRRIVAALFASPIDVRVPSGLTNTITLPGMIPQPARSRAIRSAGDIFAG
jgi:hypothetical protein